ncbi:GNAT family N-acetyltransferase [Catellatospora vulcania]|uniref:GNAT family N-acetyltransferase n=1 Tax=Catellatospora vulcania TaxID=1460450 RepID=UPI0012D44847|nr:GNAT family N-acetyltransferase [Catellatospora vulcania]
MMLDIERQVAAVEIVYRAAGESDLARLVELHRRCSPETLARRYASAAGAPPRARIAHMLTPEAGHTLLAVVSGGTDDGAAVAVAHLLTGGTHGDGNGGVDSPRSGPDVAPGGTAVAEAALLVADAWQRRGIGAVLARRLAVLAAVAGYTHVQAHVLAGNQPALRTIRRLVGGGGLGGAPVWAYDGPMLTMTVPVARPA